MCKNILAIVRKVVDMKGSLYLCIPKSIVKQCGVKVGDEVGIVSGRRTLIIVLPEDRLGGTDHG
jgi:antitoxin component of MazEF toxin-antitoxin module